MDNLLTTMPLVHGKFVWYIGNKSVGWIAPEDLAAVAARVVVEGPERHGGKQYWLSSEVLNGAEAAAEISEGLGQPVEAVVLNPRDLLQMVEAGSIRILANIDASYGASMLEWVQQTFDGRMDFGAVKTNTVEDLTGGKTIEAARLGQRKPATGDRSRHIGGCERPNHLRSGSPREFLSPRSTLTRRSTGPSFSCGLTRRRPSTGMGMSRLDRL
jgi:hypothetical protein